MLLADRVTACLPDDSVEVTCYLSVRGEPDTTAVIAVLLERGHRVWLPRVAGKNLEWVRIGDDTTVEIGSMGIPQPSGVGRAGLDFADVLLMPALAVDESGRRLGQGGGFYDRSLNSVPTHADGGPELIALVYDDEVVATVPTDQHDRPVDLIVTPTRTLRSATRA